MRILTSKFFNLLLLFIFLSACARTPVPISDERILQSIEADLANLKYEDSIESIDLYKAISLAIRNNRDLRVEVMNSALQQRQNNLPAQNFESSGFDTMGGGFNLGSSDPR